jgi:hypothetical protein
MHFRRAVGALSLALVLGLGSLAKAAPVQPVVTAFQVERERLTYDPAARTVSSTIFVVPAGAPIPTPLSTDLSKATTSFYVVGVNEPVISTKPYPSILFTGTVISNPTGTPFGPYLGAAAEISAGYSTDTPPKLNNVVNLIAGATISYSPEAVGTLTISEASIKSLPNPVLVTGGGGAVTTISWNAPKAGIIEIHLGSPTGQLFVYGGNRGTAKTGPWVNDGMVFYLQDVTGGKPLTPENTLATVVVHVQRM